MDFGNSGVVRINEIKVTNGDYVFSEAIGTRLEKKHSMKKVKGEVTLTVTYENDAEFYPKGSTPVECLDIDIKNFREDLEMFIMYYNARVSERILDVVK